MTHRSSHSQSSITAGVSLLALLIAGCVVIPYPVIPDVEQIDDVHLADDVLVSAGPRRLLEGLSERIEKADPALTVVDPIAFRDAAFPEGGWRLADLLEPERCQRVTEGLGVKFLVLVGSGAAQVSDEMGIAAPLMLPVSAATIHETSVLSAVVFDLESGKAACQLRSEAEGISVFLQWVVFGAFAMPLTGSSAERGLADALAEALLDEADGAPLRIAVMAAEASGDPFVAYEGAPITVGRDIAVSEMVNRLANIEADVTPGATSRDDIRDLLGDPMASHSELRVDVYRFTAVVESKARPFIVLGNFRWSDREERPYAGYLLVTYDAESKVVDLASAFVAAAVASDAPQNPLGSPAQSAYDYAFERAAVASVTGFRIEVEHLGQGTREALYTEPDGVLVFENGEWSSQEMPPM